METLLQDVRYGLRMLRKSPGFTLLAVITLALGIGANTAIFSVVYEVMLRPLPYAQPDRLVKVTLQWKHGGIANSVTPVLASAVLENNRVFQSSAMEFPATGCNLAGGGAPEYVPAKRVSAGFFGTLGVAPALGREFLESEAAGGHSAVLSYGLWQNRFGADRNILGQQIACNGETYTVVGVLPRSFRYERRADVWLPDRLAHHLQDSGLNYDLIARLRPGVSLAQAREDGRRMWAQLAREHGSAWYVRNTEGFNFIPYQRWLARDVRPSLLFLLGAVALVLLIAVANVAGLMLARTTARAREIAVRAALGATRARIVGQLITEAVLLSLLGGSAGVLLAWYLNGGLKAIFPTEVALHMPVQLDLTGLALNGPVLIYTVVISCAVGILAGTVPALRCLGAHPNAALKRGERSVGSS